MIQAFLLLFLCQLVGEVASRIGISPLPGPVAGMGLLFLTLCWRGATKKSGTHAVPHDLATLADGLLRHLSLLYVPVSVGIIERLDLVRAHPLAICAAIVISTIAAQGATALVFEHLLRRRGTDALTPSGQLR
jgi:holin-like protein